MNNKKSGFTLVELVVVITIISILVAIAVPKLQQYRILAHHQVIATTARQIGLASTVYLLQNEDLIQATPVNLWRVNMGYTTGNTYIDKENCLMAFNDVTQKVAPNVAFETFINNSIQNGEIPKTITGRGNWKCVKDNYANGSVNAAGSPWYNPWIDANGVMHVATSYLENPTVPVDFIDGIQQ